MLIEVSPIPDAVLPLEAFKTHLRMGSGFGTADIQDGVVASFLRAAIAAVEARTGKAVLRRLFRLSVTGWHMLDVHVLPIAPVERVTLVEQVSAHDERTLTISFQPCDIRSQLCNANNACERHGKED